MKGKLCVFLLACVALSSCGGSDEGAADPSAQAAACKALTADFLTSLDTLRKRLISPIDYPQYVDALKAVRRSYDELPVDRLEEGCIRGAGGAAEDTFNEYIDAANVWGRCLDDPSCDPVAFMPVVEKRWWGAGQTLSRAHAALAAGSASS